MSFRVEATEVLNYIQQQANHLLRDVDREAKASAMTIVRDAKTNAPASHGALKRAINWRKIGDMQYEITVDVDYAAYVEFGTRSNVQIPQGWEQVAEQARGTGRIGNMTARDAIYEWARRKGIDEQYWWSIYLRIMTDGLKPQPYLVPAFENGMPEFIERLKLIIEGK